MPIVRGMLMSVYEVMLGEAATFVQRKWTAAKQEAIAAMLPTGERDGLECETCCICQELVDPAAANPIALLKCGHYFHRECILGWDRSICAICRAAHSLRDIQIV